MYFDLKNRIYVVTGASGGIGSALVNLLNKEGAELFLIDTDQTSLEQLKKEQATYQNQNYFINSNLKDFKEITDNLQKPISGIIHLAGQLESDNVTTSKVPLLGDLPILGRLFRNDDTVKRKSELIILVTPNIIND